MHAESLWSCPTLCSPVDCGLPGFSVRENGSPGKNTGVHWPSFPGGSDGKASAYNAGDPGSVPGLGRSSGEGNGHPLKYSCLENPMDGGAWLAIVHGVTKSRTD